MNHKLLYLMAVYHKRCMILYYWLSYIEPPGLTVLLNSQFSTFRTTTTSRCSTCASSTSSSYPPEMPMTRAKPDMTKAPNTSHVSPSGKRKEPNFWSSLTRRDTRTCRCSSATRWASYKRRRSKLRERSSTWVFWIRIPVKIPRRKIQGNFII